MRDVIRSMSASATGSTATTTEIAMQRSPAEPKPALTAESATRSRSASGSTSMWFFAPPSACTRLPCFVPVSYTYCAMGVDPTNEIARTSGCVSSPSTASLSPFSTVKTPSGRPARFHSSAIQMAALGSFSLGVRITVLPAAIAMGKNHIGTIAGKLNGEIIPTTPSGCFVEYTSTPVDTCSEYSPLRWCARPVANSTTSWPRVISPSASLTTLPCSDVMISASSPFSASSSSRKRKRIACRLASDRSRQAGNAAFADAMARWISSASASATSFVTTTRAGS